MRSLEFFVSDLLKQFIKSLVFVHKSIDIFTSPLEFKRQEFFELLILLRDFWLNFLIILFQLIIGALKVVQSFNVVFYLCQKLIIIIRYVRVHMLDYIITSIFDWFKILIKLLSIIIDLRAKLFEEFILIFKVFLKEFELCLHFLIDFWNL